MARRKNTRVDSREQDSRNVVNQNDNQSEDPAMSAAHRDDMTETPMHGDELEPDMMESGSDQSMQSQRGMRTNKRANDERYDDASDFSGRGGQKEGSRQESESQREGTGYTENP